MKNIPEELIPVIDYWEQHGKTTVAVALVAIVAGVGYWAWDRARTETRMEVSDTLVENFAGSTSASDAVAELQEALDKAVDASAKPLLKLRLAKMQYAAGDYAAATALYTELKDAAPAGFEDVPAFGLAATLEAEGKFAEARTAYEGCLKDYPASVMKLEAELGIARSLAQAGEKAAAVKMLEDRQSAVEGLEAARLTKKAALEKAEANTLAVRKKELPAEEKVKALAEADAAVDALKKELAALDAELQTKDLTTARVKATLDLVKRWENRRESSLAEAVSQAKEALQKVEPAPAAAPAAPAEKKAE